MGSNQELRVKPGGGRGLPPKIRIMKDELEMLSGGRRVDT